MKYKKRNSIILATVLIFTLVFSNMMVMADGFDSFAENPSGFSDYCDNDSWESNDMPFGVDICVFLGTPGTPAVGEVLRVYLDGQYYATLLETWAYEGHGCGKTQFNTTRAGTFTWTARNGQQYGVIGTFNGLDARFEVLQITLPVYGAPGGGTGGGPGDGYPGDGGPGDGSGDGSGDGNNNVVEINRANLSAAIIAAETRTEENYTAESWGVFVAALSSARYVYHNPYATQAQINYAFEALQTAVNNLVAAGVGQAGQGGQTGQTGGGAPQTGDGTTALYLYLLLASGSMIIITGVELSKRFKIKV